MTFLLTEIWTPRENWERERERERKRKRETRGEREKYIEREKERDEREKEKYMKRERGEKKESEREREEGNWFSTSGHQIIFEEAVFRTKCFTAKWKILIKVALCILKQNIATLWFLCCVPNRDNKLPLRFLKVFAKYFAKS